MNGMTMTEEKKMAKMLSEKLDMPLFKVEEALDNITREEMFRIAKGGEKE